jgi:UDPglucose 6-dehydrogenase
MKLAGTVGMDNRIGPKFLKASVGFGESCFKKDTNDTRESAAINVASDLLLERAIIQVYDPKVKSEQVLKDLLNVLSKNAENLPPEDLVRNNLFVRQDPYEAMKNAHAVAIIIEWDEFTTYDWHRIYQNILKPAFIFDGRNILNATKLRESGFKVFQIGKGY